MINLVIDYIVRCDIDGVYEITVGYVFCLVFIIYGLKIEYEIFLKVIGKIIIELCFVLKVIFINENIGLVIFMSLFYIFMKYKICLLNNI